MKLLKKILTVAFTFFAFLGIFFLESRLSMSETLKLKSHVYVVVAANESIALNHAGNRQNIQGPREIDLWEGDVVETLQAVATNIHFSDAGVMRITSSSVIRLAVLEQSVSGVTPDRSARGVSFQLLQGRVWVNDLFASGSVNFLAGGAYLIPDQAVFDVSYDNSKTIVYAVQHQLVVGLVPLDYVFGPILSVPAEDFVNSYLLPQGNSTTVVNDTLKTEAETLKKLLYSKLIKEFQYGLFDQDQLKNDLWFTKNQKADNDFYKEISEAKIQKIRDHGLKIDSLSSFAFQLEQMVHKSGNALTFAPDRVISFNLADIFDVLFDSEYLTVLGKTSDARERFDYVGKLIGDRILIYDESFGKSLLAALQKEYYALAFVQPSDQLFDVKKTVANLLIEHLGSTQEDVREKFLLVRAYLNSVYDLVKTNIPVARSTLDDYYKNFGLLLTREKNHLFLAKNSLIEENQIMENLFLQYPQFYRDTYFAMKNRLEQELLAVINDENDLNEQKQTLVSDKIDLLKQLKNFFLADKVTVEDARQIVFRLFKEIDNLQLPPEAQVAVGELFAKRIEDFGVFFRYLNSSEYVGTTLHGASHQEQYKEFLQAQAQQQLTMEQLKQEVLQGSSSAGTTGQSAVTSSGQSAQNPVSTGGQATVSPVSTGTGGQLSASPTGQNGQLPTGSAGQLGNSGQAGESGTGTSGQSSVNPSGQLGANPSVVPPPANPKVSRVAKILLMQKLKASGVIVAEDQIQVVDIAKSTFIITGAVLSDNTSIQFSFSFNQKSETVSNLIVTTSVGQKPFEGNLPLGDLVVQVKNIFQQFSQ